MQLTFQELRDLLLVVQQTGIAELTLKGSDFELTLRAAVTTPVALDSVAIATPVALPSVAPEKSPAPPSSPPLEDKPGVDIISPIVGTFYQSPAPGEPPFVSVGDRVRAGQTVCIIEAMKLMNEIEAEVAGEVVDIYVTNGQPVEYGQALMRVRPA
ncbi:MAG: acetyl-CoA carboxylase biotin carboxyl carrier protein [Gloeomargaritaceae cyanobacterium C42_A2020_066]|nr:acetyl-CoA carboxylase biotin carboxyl carrier protein [Gloeomargaritaceae cyanobacterium C42_A2020_066]